VVPGDGSSALPGSISRLSSATGSPSTVLSKQDDTIATHRAANASLLRLAKTSIDFEIATSSAAILADIATSLAEIGGGMVP